MRRSLTALAVMFAALVLLAGAPPAVAADSPVGTWVKKGEAGQPATTMDIEQWASGKVKVTWHIAANMVLTIVSTLDGSFAPLLMNGKPSGETMSIKIVDKLHAAAVIKMNGKQVGTSKTTFSPDFKTMTVEGNFNESVGGNQGGKQTEIWTRK